MDQSYRPSAKRSNKTIKKLKILVVGSLPPPVGGTSVSLEYLVGALKRCPYVSPYVLNTNGIRGKGFRGVLRLGWVLCRLAAAAWKVDVVTLHCATTALPFFGIMVLIIARLFGKPLIVRKFAGFDYFMLGRVRGCVAHAVVRHADLYLAQTKQRVEEAARNKVRHVRWYPTSRPKPDYAAHGSGDSKRCRHFVYVGQVREYKGMRELAEAAKGLDEDLTVHVYGPWFDDLPEGLFDHSPNASYRGTLAPKTVMSALSKYDAVVLPTKATTEGYPGLILEGYALGLPVVATTCGAIPEIVDESTGILVAPGDSDGLRRAMLRMSRDQDLYNSLRAGARRQASCFDSDKWTREFVVCCREVSIRRSVIGL